MTDKNYDIHLPEGVYLVRVTWQGETKLHVAEWCGVEWAQLGIDYNIWEYSHPPAERIEVICGLDLEKIAEAAARAV